MTVRRLDPTRDWAHWRRMRHALWPDATEAGHEPSMREWLARADAATFVAEREDATPCGFVEVGTRPYADGCDTSPVGYVEGWYVDAGARRRGYGAALVAAAERWARDAGCAEMASDALLDNDVSIRAHARLGYEEVDRVVQFRKAL